MRHEAASEVEIFEVRLNGGASASSIKAKPTGLKIQMVRMTLHTYLERTCRSISFSFLLSSLLVIHSLPFPIHILYIVLGASGH